MAARSRRTGGTSLDSASEGATLPTGDLLYLYCVVEAGTAAHRLLAAQTLPGLQPDRHLFPIEAGGLVAGVSRVPGETFDEGPLNALLADLPRVAPFVIRHEEAVRALLDGAPAVLPMTFGAVYAGPDRIGDLLRARGAEFGKLLDRVRDKEEWGLKVFRDVPRSLEAAMVRSDVLAALTREIDQAAPGRAYLLRKRQERLLTSEAQRIVADALATMLADLAELSAATREDPLAAEDAGPVKLVAKVAFLVTTTSVEAFRARAAALERAVAPVGLTLEVSGPWAPYSFVGGSDGGL